MTKQNKTKNQKLDLLKLLLEFEEYNTGKFDLEGFFKWLKNEIINGLN